jgi:hypothetical protein
MMPRLIVEAADDGLHVSREVLDAAGVTPGTLFQIEALPTPEQIQTKALGYVCWKLGDAIRVGDPVWEGDAWRVPLISPYEVLQIGDLYLDSHGEVITERAPGHEELVARIDAARTSTAAA